MKITPLKIPSAYLLQDELIIDDRGSFARTFCTQELAPYFPGEVLTICQTSVAVNPTQYTLRGMHFQKPPHQEIKIVRCLRGRIFDVLVDLRPESPTRGQWASVELSVQSRQSLLVPKGVAHGYLTLEPDTEVQYMMTVDYQPAAYSGLRWNDPAVAIAWPFQPAIVSEKDQNLAFLKDLLPSP